MDNHIITPPMGNQKNPPLFLAFMLAVVSALTLAGDGQRVEVKP